MSLLRRLVPGSAAAARRPKTTNDLLQEMLVSATSTPRLKTPAPAEPHDPARDAAMKFVRQLRIHAR